MLSTEEQKSTIELMAKHEELIGRLYYLFSQKFLSHKNFWLDLTKAEMKHAQMIRTLSSKIQNGSVHFNEKRFKMPAIKFSIKYIENKIIKIKEEDISLPHALAISSDIEKSLLEKKCLEIFESDSIEIKHVFTVLQEETRKHLAKVEKELEKIKKL